MLNTFSGLLFGQSNRTKWGLVSTNNESSIRYGTNTHFGQNIGEYADEAGCLDEIVSLGLNSIRDNVLWEYFEAVSGSYTFNPTGDVYSRNVFTALAHNKAQGYGIHTTLGCMWGNNAVHTDPTHPDPVWSDHFCDAMEDMAQNYIAAGYDPALLTLELWNEPTGSFSGIFNAAAEADDMAVLLQEFYARIKAVDSAIEVIGPAMSDGSWAGHNAWNSAFFGVAGWSQAIDAYSSHEYYTGDVAALRYPERLMFYLRNYQTARLNPAALADGSLTLPIVENEFGWDTTTFTNATATKYYPRMLCLLSSVPNLREATLYELIDSVGTYGLCSSLGVRKSQATAVAAILVHLKLAAQRRYYWSGGSFGNGYHAVLLETTSGQRLAVWSLNGNRTTTINVNASAAGTLSVQTIGSTTATQALTYGLNVVSVALTDTAKVLFADVGITFPEFEA